MESSYRSKTQAIAVSAMDAISMGLLVHAMKHITQTKRENVFGFIARMIRM